MAFGFTSGGIAMTSLRQRMTEDMQLPGWDPCPQQAYLRYVEQLALFTGKSPDLATDEDFRQFFLALHTQRGCSRSTATVAIAAFQFLLEYTLQRPWPRLDLFRPRPTQTLPVILSVDEVWRILSQLDHPTYYTCLATFRSPVACASAKASTSKSAGSTARACSCKYAAARARRIAISHC